MKKKVSILQTGRLGDLWFTIPLAHWFHQQGHEVEIVYDDVFGNPFAFFTYIKPRPVKMPKYFKKNKRWGHFLNEAVWQLNWLWRLKREGKKVVWNQVYPFRLFAAYRRKAPYVEYWYRKYPQVNFRMAESSLEVTNEKTILVFQESQSPLFKMDESYYDWIFRNLDALVAVTGYKPILVLYGDQPERAGYESWRGSLDDYQRLIASCGMVFGISTSAHVLGQLLGKPVIALYGGGQSIVDTIGAESARLEFPHVATEGQFAELESLCR